MGPSMSTRDEMKPPIIKAMHILFTVVLLSWNSPLSAPLSAKAVWELCACVLQGYAGTEESLGNCVLLVSDMSDTARENVFPSTAKLKAALRLLFTKQPTWVWSLCLSFVNVCICVTLFVWVLCARLDVCAYQRCVFVMFLLCLCACCCLISLMLGLGVFFFSEPDKLLRV